MRPLLLALLATCCFAPAALRAQEPAPLPKPETQDPADPNATPTATPAAPELIPADILPPPDPSSPGPMPDIPTIPELDQAMSPPPLSPAAQAYQQHIEWRKLRNQAQNDPRVKAALAEADAAKTDLQRRKLLARYLEIFHARQIALASPAMKQYLLDRKKEHLAALPQPRVRPETAPKPTPTPKPSASAAPGASPSPSPSAAGAPGASPSPSPRGSSLLRGLPRP